MGCKSGKFKDLPRCKKDDWTGYLAVLVGVYLMALATEHWMYYRLLCIYVRDVAVRSEFSLQEVSLNSFTLA